MDLATTLATLNEIAAEMSSRDLPTTCTTTTSSKGVTLTLKTKRSRHASEGVVRGAAGLHTFACLVAYDDAGSWSSLTKEADPDSGELSTHEDGPHEVTSLDELTEHISTWREHVTRIENEARVSREKAQRNAPASLPKTPKASTPRTLKAAQQKNSSRATPQSAPTAPMRPPRTDGCIKASNAKDIDLRHYVRIGDWYAPKVIGEYTNEELIEFFPDHYSPDNFTFASN